MSDLDSRDGIERIEVEPHADEAAVVSLDDSVRLIVDAADVDDSDNLRFYRESVGVARVEVPGVPLEVPTLVRRAVGYGERGVWE